MTRMLIAVIAVLLVLPNASPAQDTGLDEALQGFGEERSRAGPDRSLEGALEGFDEEPGSVRPDERSRASGDPPIEVKGSVAASAVSNVHSHRSSDGTEQGGLSRLRLTLDLTLDAQLPGSWDATVRGRGFRDVAYAINGREQYTGQVLGSLESEAELREAFLRGKVLPWLDVKVGRQIVVWGKSDNLRVTDVLNPLDNREPGMVDIEDLRLPLAMGRIDAYAGKWSLSAIAIPEIRFNKNPPYGSDFYPSAMPPPAEVIPPDGGSSTEYAFALNGILTGWDVAFYGARMYDDRPSSRFISFFPVPQVELVHDRLTMAGAAVNVALGNWLLKTEGALFDGLRFAVLPDKDFSRLDGLAGIEYSGFSETTLSFEAVHRRLREYESALLSSPDFFRQDEVQTALRLQRDFLHQRLHLTVLALSQGWNGREGKMQRFTVKYDLTDHLALSGGFVNYGSGTRPEFRNVGKSDRVFLEAKYSF